MGFFFLWIIGCIIAAVVGKNKTIGSAGAFFISLFLSPLVGIIFALASKDIADLDFQNKVIDQSYNLAPAPSAADELGKFKDLLDQHAISEEEYDNKKRQLLG